MLGMNCFYLSIILVGCPKAITHRCKFTYRPLPQIDVWLPFDTCRLWNCAWCEEFRLTNSISC